MKLSYDPAKFGGHKHSGTGDIMVFVYRMTLPWKITYSKHLMIHD